MVWTYYSMKSETELLHGVDGSVANREDIAQRWFSLFGRYELDTGEATGRCGRHSDRYLEALGG